MLDSFEISNFRLFQYLEFRRLKRVNLVVGRNNAGKSKFLEAMQHYASNAADLVESRQETWLSEVQIKPQHLSGDSVRLSKLFFKRRWNCLGITINADN